MGEPIHGFLSINSQGHFAFTDKKEGPMAMKVALESLHEVGKERPHTAPTLEQDNVVLACRDEDNGGWVQAKIKITEVAKLIGKDTEATKQSIESGELHQDINDALVKHNPPEIAITSPIAQATLELEMPASVRKQIEANLSSYGLTPEEFREIQIIYAKNRIPAEMHAATENKAIFIGRNVIRGLPRSIVYIPSGPQKGFHILLKTHGVEEDGVGTFSTFTKSINLDTGMVDGFRTAKSEDVFTGEIKANALVQKYPHAFVGGYPVAYSGTYRLRKGRDKASRQVREPKMTEKIPKTGFIMARIEGGDLSTRADKKPHLTEQEVTAIFHYLASSLALLHDDLKLTHRDLKLENILLTKEGSPRIADFSMTHEIGAPCGASGTRGYKAPEICLAIEKNEDDVANPASDIWSLGCLMGSLIYGHNWLETFGDVVNDNASHYDRKPASFEKLVKKNLRNYKNPNHIDHILYKCLKWNPAKRPPAKDVATLLAKLQAARTPPPVLPAKTPSQPQAALDLLAGAEGEKEDY